MINRNSDELVSANETKTFEYQINNNVTRDDTESRSIHNAMSALGYRETNPLRVSSEYHQQISNEMHVLYIN
jgi:hypothetical protein